MKKRSKFLSILLFGILAMFIGALIGIVVQVFLKAVSLCGEALWSGSHSLPYYLIICLAGALLIGLWQKKFGILPDTMEEVMAVVKDKGSYPYNNIHVIAVAAFMPLFFGGAIGPEAGLTGVIVGLCYWMSDTLKRRGHKLADMFNDENAPETLAEAGFAASLGIIFGAPLFGIVNNLEPDDSKEKYKDRLLSKKQRIFIYIMCVLGAVLAMAALGKLLDLLGLSAAGGLPRFDIRHEVSLLQWAWIPVLMLLGIALAGLHIVFERVTSLCAGKIRDKRILSSLIAGLAVAFAGFLLPDTLLSGEAKLGELINDWQSMSILLLFAVVVVKLLLMNICVNFGWKGGAVFPIIFCGVALGYAAALVIGIDGAFAAAVVVSSMYAFITQKPLMAVAVLLLCFPVTYLPPLCAAALASGLVRRKLSEKIS